MYVCFLPSPPSPQTQTYLKKVLSGPFKSKFYASFEEIPQVKHMHLPYSEIKFNHVIMKIYLPNGAFRSSSAQNGHCLFHKGNHETDKNLIASKILNLFFIGGILSSVFRPKEEINLYLLYTVCQY